MAILAIEGMQFYAHHGFYEVERKVGGNYSVDVFATIDDEHGKDDELEGTINYEAIYEITQSVMAVSAKLIEHIGHEIMNKLKDKFPEAKQFKVRVIKHNPPLSGEVQQTTYELIA